MKRITYIALFAVLFASLLLSCTETEPEESCDAEDYCEQLPDIDLIATFCSDGESNSYYTYNGVDYTCDGVESSTCATALSDISAQMMADQPDCFAKKGNKEGVKALKTRLSNNAEKLLMDVRLNSINKGSLNF